MNRLKIQFLLGLITIVVLLVGLFAIYNQQQLSESETTGQPSPEVLIARGYAQAIKDIKNGKPKFYIYGLIKYDPTVKIEVFKKHNITPVFQGCIIDEGSEYNFSYNKTIKNAFPDSKNTLDKFL
jgi:hypothetical protein